MSSRARMPFLSALALVAVLAAAGCGSSHTKVTTGTYAGESGANAPYLDVGPLIYQVELSRQLSPFDTEDQGYLIGLSEAQRTLSSGQGWLGVFVQIYNNTSTALPAASSMTISDTQGNRYTPIPPGQSNEFAYRAGSVPPKGRLPVPDSTAASGPTQGALLLYKIQLASLDNRPLTLTIVDPSDASQRASAELDV